MTKLIRRRLFTNTNLIRKSDQNNPYTPELRTDPQPQTNSDWDSTHGINLQPEQKVRILPNFAFDFPQYPTYQFHDLHYVIEPNLFPENLNDKGTLPGVGKSSYDTRVDNYYLIALNTMINILSNSDPEQILKGFQIQDWHYVRKNRTVSRVNVNEEAAYRGWFTFQCQILARASRLVDVINNRLIDIINGKLIDTDPDIEKCTDIIRYGEEDGDIISLYGDTLEYLNRNVQLSNKVPTPSLNLEYITIPSLTSLEKTSTSELLSAAGRLVSSMGVIPRMAAKITLVIQEYVDGKSVAEIVQLTTNPPIKEEDGSPIEGGYIIPFV